jgi:cell division protein FtsB
MKLNATLVLLVCALIAAIASFVVDDGFGKLSSLQSSLDLQRRTNSRLDENVQQLKRRTAGLTTDPRAIEKAARSELGMARPDELVVIFEKKDEKAQKSK